MVEVMTSKNSNKSYNSGKKETKASSGLRRTLRKALDFELAVQEPLLGPMARLTAKPVPPSMAPQSSGLKTVTRDLRANMPIAPKDLPTGRKLGNTWPSILADRLSEKSLPEALCSRAAPCWLCRYVRTFLCLEKLRGINYPNKWQIRAATARRLEVPVAGWNGPCRRVGPRDRRQPKSLFHHPV